MEGTNKFAGRADNISNDSRVENVANGRRILKILCSQLTEYLANLDDHENIFEELNSKSIKELSREDKDVCCRFIYRHPLAFYMLKNFDPLRFVEAIIMEGSAQHLDVKLEKQFEYLDTSTLSDTMYIWYLMDYLGRTYKIDDNVISVDFSNELVYLCFKSQVVNLQPGWLEHNVAVHKVSPMGNFIFVVKIIRTISIIGMYEESNSDKFYMSYINPEYDEVESRITLWLNHTVEGLSSERVLEDSVGVEDICILTSDLKYTIEGVRNNKYKEYGGF